MARTVQSDRKGGRAEPLDVTPEATDAALLDAVVDHWHACLMTADGRDALLAHLGISLEMAVALRIGLSDRTLGLRLPGRRWKSGLVLRSRLADLGIMRPSGHEAFRGCVTIPVVDPVGTVTGIFGIRTDPRLPGVRGAVWATGLPGGIFAAADQLPESDPVPGDPTVVVSTVLDALALLGAGCRAVIAPGREKGFTGGDLESLAGRPGELCVMGRDTGPLAEALAELGASVAVAATGVDLAMVLGSGAVPADALASLLEDRQVVSRLSAPPMVGDQEGSAGTPAHCPPTLPSAFPTASPTVPPSVTVTEGRNEVFVQSATRSWRIRGAGARGNTEGDLLRVALSVTDLATGRFHLDTLDLYVARLRGHFLDAAATELRSDREALALELAEVIHAAEQCRDVAGASVSAPAPTMSDAERDEAMDWLTSPDLMERLSGDLRALGVVGEETNLVVCYLAVISRLCERPFGVVVQSSSAAGKSTLTDAVCSLVPGEDLVTLSAITAQALYYLGGGDLARKVLAIAEEQGAARASYALKLLVSEGRLSIASTGKDRSTGRLSTSSYEISGPVALVMTTTATDIDPEMENRLVVLGVNEDPTQTRAIVEAQRRAATVDGLVARAARDGIRRLHADAQRLLDPFPVVIPELAAHFPTSATRHRRDHAKLLSIISAVTLLHQHQRDQRTVAVAGETITYLEATEADVAMGLDIAARVLSRGPDNLAPQTARMLRAVDDHTSSVARDVGCRASEVEVTRRELRELLGWSDIQVRRATDRLVALEYLVVAGGGRGRCRTYHYVAEIGQVGHPSGQVGHRRRPTGHPTHAGASDQLVTLVGLDDDHITNGSHVGDDDHSDRPISRRGMRS